MKLSLKKISFVSIVSSFTISASLFAFGTEFVCCTSQSVSCTSGGGATVFSKILYDHALTKVDARLRCGFSTMYWNTDRCPSNTGCSGGGSGGGGTAPPPPAPTFTANYHNGSSDSVYVAYWKAKYPRWETHGWWEVKPNESKSFTFEQIFCLAVQQYGQDKIAKVQQTNLITGDFMTMQVNRTRKTDLVYGVDNNNHYWANILVDGILPQKSYTGFSGEGLNALFQTAQFETFKCFLANESHLHASLN